MTAACQEVGVTEEMPRDNTWIKMTKRHAMAFISFSSRFFVEAAMRMRPFFRLNAWRRLRKLYRPCATASATRMPSTAAETMPPA